MESAGSLPPLRRAALSDSTSSTTTTTKAAGLSASSSMAANRAATRFPLSLNHCSVAGGAWRLNDENNNEGESAAHCACARARTFENSECAFTCGRSSQ